jgi:hypothetical protein
VPSGSMTSRARSGPETMKEAATMRETASRDGQHRCINLFFMGWSGLVPTAHKAARDDPDWNEPRLAYGCLYIHLYNYSFMSTILSPEMRLPAGNQIICSYICICGLYVMDSHLASAPRAVWIVTLRGLRQRKPELARLWFTFALVLLWVYRCFNSMNRRLPRKGSNG